MESPNVCIATDSIFIATRLLEYTLLVRSERFIRFAVYTI